MFTMKGQFNKANVMIDDIDQTTKDQIQGFLNHPAFKDTYIAIMPDCHAGKGAVVGFTMKMNDYIIPNIIGVDIGCGMLMNVIKDFEDFDLPSFDAFIKSNIPFGFRINDKPTISTELEKEVRQVCSMIGLEPQKTIKALGSLGGGNHFIEAGYNNAHEICITIHSGSRNLGKYVADFYQKKAKEGLEKFFIRDLYKDLEFMPIDSADALDYFYCLGVAQRFASENRKEMMRRITDFLDQDVIKEIESVHNFIGDDNVIRKGATPARGGESVIIPFNMRDGIAIGIGKGSSKYNNSAPHGAGRILSRTQAKKQLSMDDFTAQMVGVYTTTANLDTLDEAPGAYKDKDIILSNIMETVDIVDFVKPVYNFKASE